MLVLFSLGTLSKVFAESSNIFKKLHGFKQSADILATIYVRSATECAARCTSRPSCASYNLATRNDGESSRMRACELMEEVSDSTMLSAASGWALCVGKCEYACVYKCRGS